MYLKGNSYEVRLIRSYDSKAESRLTRRTSSLEGGTVVDISPYLLHSESFAVMNNAIYNCKLILNVSFRVEYQLRECDVTTTYKVNNQEYHGNVSALYSWKRGSNWAMSFNHIIRNNLWGYYAYKQGVKTNMIKAFNVKIHNTRKSKEKFYSVHGGAYGFEDYFLVYDTEPCYYMFDVEVEYQKKAPTQGSLFVRTKPAVYETYNKVYRSNFTSLTAAALDVQSAISKDTKDELPIINFVKVVKYPL